MQASGRTIAEIASSAQTASLKSEETLATIDTGRAKMQRMVEMVGSIAASSEQISTITVVIEEIADHTNLLSLNAAIEAAGELARTADATHREVDQFRTEKAAIA